MKAYVTLKVFNKKGKLIKRHKQKCKSFLKNFACMLRSMFCTVPSSSICFTDVVDVNGNTFTYPSDASKPFNNFVFACHKNAVNIGIVIGSGTSANTTNTYALENIITSDLNVYSYSYGDIVVSNSTVSFKLQKKFTNKGPTINVNEVGLYAQALDKTEKWRTICVARDVLSTTIQVQQDQNLVVEYEIKITIS